MNPKITPEIRTALSQHPVGPIQLEDDSSNEPIFVIRMGDVAHLQEAVDRSLRDKLAEADADLAAGDVAPWDAEDIKQRGQARLRAQEHDE